MRRSLFLVPTCLFMLITTMTAQASLSACRAPFVLDQMLSAIGAANWDRISETSAYGRASMAGLEGTARFDYDLIHGRYARRFKISVMGSNAEIYDGKTVWSQDISGGVHPYDSPYARRQSVTSAYLARRGYFDRREQATFTCLGTRVDGGRPEIVIRVQPKGGSPADLAIDTKTHLLSSVSVRSPLQTSVVTYGDYRTIDGLVLPFSVSSGTKADPTDDYAFSVTRYDIRRQVHDADFSKPVPPDNIQMVGGAASTTVPMMLEGRQLMVWAAINGHAPMPFILDTGGHAILTTLAARALRLKASGAGESGGSGAGTISTQYTHVNSVRVGNAELLDQPFLVIAYPYSFYERGKRTPLAGIIGLELFERYAVRLDYGDRTVTLSPLSTFHHNGHNGRGTAVAFTFESDPDMPMVEAAADGHQGLIGIDTGNAGNLILFGDFLKRTGLLWRYSPGVRLIGQGTGGSNTGHLENLRSFAIGGHDLRNVATNFTRMNRGSFSAWTQAGNMGFSILSRFIPTFDYAHQKVYLDPELRETPIDKNRAGIAFAKNEPDAFDVLLVRPESAASAAGIAAGDRIVAVNGKDASNYSRADLVEIVAQGTGTRVNMRIQRAGVSKNVSIVLR